MNPDNLRSILELINMGVSIGGTLLPVALRAFAALKAETGMDDDQLTAISSKLNAEHGQKLADLIAKTGG